MVDFERWTAGPHSVERIEYDPGRSAHIALLSEQATGRKSYIVAAEGMRAGDVVQSYRSGIPPATSSTAWAASSIPVSLRRGQHGEATACPCI